MKCTSILLDATLKLNINHSGITEDMYLVTLFCVLQLRQKKTAVLKIIQTCGGNF